MSGDTKATSCIKGCIKARTNILELSLAAVPNPSSLLSQATQVTRCVCARVCKGVHPCMLTCVVGSVCEESFTPLTL